MLAWGAHRSRRDCLARPLPSGWTPIAGPARSATQRPTGRAVFDELAGALAQRADQPPPCGNMADADGGFPIGPVVKYDPQPVIRPWSSHADAPLAAAAQSLAPPPTRSHGLDRNRSGRDFVRRGRIHCGADAAAARRRSRANPALTAAPRGPPHCGLAAGVLHFRSLPRLAPAEAEPSLSVWKFIFRSRKSPSICLC